MHGPRTEPNEKFAFIAMSVPVAEGFSAVVFDEGLRATTTLPLGFDEVWKRWLGSLRAEYLEEDCTLFLYASQISQTPGILDGENIRLRGQAWRLFEALTLTGNFSVAGTPILATGAHDAGRESLRQISDLLTPLLSGGLHHHQVTADMLREAYVLMTAQIDFEHLARYDRIQRILYVFRDALREQNPHERLHQFCRCIEGFILADPGKTLSQFKSRTEMFIGPRHHLVMERLYGMRSQVEHMHDYGLDRAKTERERRLFVMRMTALTESIARSCVRQFLLNRNVWPHFVTREALSDFWKMPSRDRQAIWGAPSDMDALERNFDPTILTDAMLGLP